MKKILSLILALALVMSLSVTAFAAEDNGNGEGEAATIEISAIYKAGDAAAEIVSVDISWGAMTFEYTDGADGKWNPATHTYGEKGNGTWKAEDNAITVTNHSNVEVTVAMALTPVEGTGVEVSLTGGNGTLAAGVEGDVEGAAAVTGKLTVSGTPNDTVTAEGIKVGEITVTIE